jgi:1,4-dihydroxy-2-naphthoate octaprenyltransferase
MTPRLLVAFFAATLAMVLAVALLIRGHHHWVDFLLIGLLFVVSGVLLTEEWRELDEDEQAEDDR